MSRPLAVLLGVAAAIAVVVALSWNGGDAPTPVAPPPRAEKVAPVADVVPAAKAEPSSVAAEAVATREVVAGESDAARLAIPADAIWLEVHVVDAGTKAPVPGAIVRWINGLVWREVSKLPQLERAQLSADLDRVAERFGWQTRANAEGMAKIAADQNGAQLFANAGGRYATLYVGGRRDVPEGGWRLELEADLALRAQVLDANDQPATDVAVRILWLDESGKRSSIGGWVQPVTSRAPDGIAEFPHVQTWLRNNSASETKGLTCRVAVQLPGYRDPGVVFDRAAPPTDPIVLHLPATGSLRARLLHAGQPLIRDTSFRVSCGPDRNEDLQLPCRFAAEDGWARFPRVGIGTTLTVTASNGTGNVEGEVAAPVAAGQEVAIELDADSVFSLSGMLVGPDGHPLANAAVLANFDAEIQSGGTQIRTDENGRFLWLLAKGYVDKPTLKRLVMSTRDDAGPPLRASVSKRELTRGVNDLGRIQLATGPLVVGGRIAFDPPQQRSTNIVIEALTDLRGRNGEERWEQVRDVTATLRPDGTFEVRGETRPTRHRLAFLAYDHLPIDPIEFRIGQDDVVVTLTAGHDLEALVLVPEGLLDHALRGALTPLGRAAEPPKSEFLPGAERYTAQALGKDGEALALRWRPLPSGTYRLTIATGGTLQPIAVIDDVVLPQPAGGDPRLRAIDVREAVRIVRIVTPPPSVEPAQPFGRGLIVFQMPQDDDKGWVGAQLPVEGGAMLVPKGPLELLVTAPSCRPQRYQCNGAELQVALEPWPTLEVTIGNLPPLPEGIELHVSLRAPRVRGEREIRFSTASRSGPLSSLLAPEPATDLVVGGHVRVLVGDGSMRVSGYLLARRDRRVEMLKTWTPNEVAGGTNPSPMTLQLSTEELQKALAVLQAEPR